MTLRPFLGTAASFREAFPDVLTLAFTGRQEGEVLREHQRDVRFSEANLPQVVPCGNPRCQQGGYDLKAYAFSLSAAQPVIEGTMYCHGHEGTPKGRRTGDPCSNVLTFRMTAAFREPRAGEK